jgi:O-antigen/teichoic acid export membrane protein
MTAINKIVKESTINFTGSIIGTILGYAWLMVMTRSLSQSEVGNFTLVQSIINITLIFVLLGMHRSLDRFIPFYHASGETGKIKSLLRLIFLFSIFASLFFGSVLYLAADFLGIAVFDNPDLPRLIKIAVLSIPFLAVINIVIYTFSGYKELRYNVYLKQTLEPVLRIVFVFILALFGLGVIEWTWFYNFILIITAAVSLWLLAKNILKPLMLESTIRIEIKEIIAYSWPISIASILTILIGQTDYLILGIYHPPENVGAYRIYIQIVALLQLILGSTARIYKPVISELIPEGADQEIKKVYKQVSKWVLSITMLGFLVIALYGNQITSLLFTDAYSGYPAALVILALGTLVNSSFGPEGMTLEAYGNTKIVLLNSLISLFINIGLGFILIPKYGIVGAAIATAVTLSVNGFLGLLEIFFIYKMQPFSLKSFKYLGIGAFTGLLFYGINSWINIEGVLGLSVLVLAMVIVYIALYYLTNSVDEVDREIIARFTKYLRITK